MGPAIYCLSLSSPCPRHAEGALAVCRLDTASALADANPGPGGGPARYVTPLSALLAVGASAVDPAVLDRLAVVAGWPFDDRLVSAMLDVLSLSGSAMLAVRIGSEPQEVFETVNAIGLPCLLLPEAGLEADRWGGLMEAFVEAWLYDPASRVLVEPIATAFRLHVAARVGSADAPGRYELYELAGDGCSGPILSGPWSASVHDALLAWAPEAIRIMEPAERRWVERLRELVGLLGDDELAAVAAGRS